MKITNTKYVKYLEISGLFPWLLNFLHLNNSGNLTYNKVPVHINTLQEYIS
jgi:hypothetical protein